jgi:glycerophosphoryl diester phosphodiesterase
MQLGWSLASVVLFGLSACTESPVDDSLPALEFRLFDCGADPFPDRNTDIPLNCPSSADCQERLVTGHRGAGGNMALFAPENSLASIRLAILLGVDIVEIDVRHTSDDQLVVMHDGSLERTTGVAQQVSEMTLEQVTALPLLVEGFHGDFSCERVPTFAEVMALAKGRVNFDVDTKTNRADLVAAAIRDADMLDQAFVSTPDPDAAELARATVADVLIQARPSSLQAYETAWAHLAPEIVEIGETQIEAFVAANDIHGKMFVDVFLQDAIALTEGDTSAYLAIFDQGVDVIQSEFPFWVLDALGRRQWSSLPAHRDLGFDSPLLGD